MVATLTFQEQLATAKTEARSQFEQQLKAGYRGFAQEYARQTGRYPHPRVVEQWRRGERERFEARLGEWESGQRVEHARAEEEWKAGIVEQYPPNKYEILWTDQGARIYEKRPGIETLTQEGYYPLLSRYGPYGPEYVYYKTPQPKQAILEYTSQFTRPAEVVSFERGFVKAQQLEVTQQLQQAQGMMLGGSLYEGVPVSETYGREKGLRRGVEVASLEVIRKRAYEHPEKVWNPTGLAERLLHLFETKPLPQVATSYLTGKAQITFEPIRPFAPVAGFIAYPETIAYAGMAWVGAEPVFRPPPRLEEGGTGYRLGYVTSMVVGSLLLTEALAKTPIPKWEAKLWQKTVGAKAQSWLTQRYIEKGPAEWSGFTEKLVMKLTGAKPYLAPQIVSVPTPGIVSYQSLEAQATAWMLAETPRTSALLVSKMPGETLAKAWVTEHLFKTAMGGLSYALVEEQLRKTLEPQMPYIPKEIYATKASTMVLPMLLPIVTPKPSEIMKPKLAQKPTIATTPTIAQVPKIAEISIVAPVQAPQPVSIQAPVVTQKQVQRQVQQQLQMATQIPVKPLVAIQRPKWLSYEQPKRRRRGKGKGPIGLFWRYKRFYPVATAKEVLKMVIE